MRMNDKGLALLKKYEGYRGKAYRCAAGVWTIGYGHTSMAGEPKVVPGMTITESEGEEILKNDLVKYERAVVKALGSHISKINSNQFSALVSLCYNIGPGAIQRASVIRYIKEGRVTEAADRILSWNKAGGRVLRGLVRRREEERELYLS